jgi:hypothetical protein
MGRKYECDGSPAPKGYLGLVGFANLEIAPDGDPCGAYNFQIAFDFDDTPLRQTPGVQIDSATLTYNEVPGAFCGFSGFYFGPIVYPDCWSAGGGGAENKPNGCVEIKLPTVDWINSPPPGLVPYSATSRPAATRLSPRTWDVTEPFSWQLDPAKRPFTPAGVPGAPAAVPVGPSGYGFLMAGAIYIDNLTGEDNTKCISQVSDVMLEVTYTVTPQGSTDVH